MEIRDDQLNAVIERALAEKRDFEELQALLGRLGLFLNNESDDSVSELGWVEEDDFELIKDSPAVMAAEERIRDNQGTTKLTHARELSRATEWSELFKLLTFVLESNT